VYVVALLEDALNSSVPSMHFRAFVGGWLAGWLICFFFVSS